MTVRKVSCGNPSKLPQGMASMEWRTLSMKSTRLAQSSRRWNVVDTVLDSSIVSNLDDSKVSNFLWPFKLSSPKGGFINKRCRLGKTLLPNLLDRWISCVVPLYFLLSGHGFCEARGGDWGNREDTMRFDYDTGCPRHAA